MMSKHSCPVLFKWVYDRWGWLLSWGLGVVPAIIYHCNAVPVSSACKVDILSGYIKGKSK